MLAHRPTSSPGRKPSASTRRKKLSRAHRLQRHSESAEQPSRQMTKGCQTYGSVAEESMDYLYSGPKMKLGMIYGAPPPHAAMI